MHDDEQRKKLLNQLVSRPETLSSMDVAPETDDSGDFAVEEPEHEYGTQPDSIERAEQADSTSDKMLAQSPKDQYIGDPAIMELMKKLKSGEQINEDQDVEVEPETIDDPSSSFDMKKLAMERVKKKYLGA